MKDDDDQVMMKLKILFIINDWPVVLSVIKMRNDQCNQWQWQILLKYY